MPYQPRFKAVVNPVPPMGLVFDFDFCYRPYKADSASTDRRVHVGVEVLGPLGASEGAPPLVLFSSGFLQRYAAYWIFLTELRAAGCTVVLYDKSFETLGTLMDDVDSAALVLRVRAEVLGRLPVAAPVPVPGSDPRNAVLSWPPCFLAGHSRGAKVSVLAAAAAAAAAKEPLTASDASAAPAPAPLSGLILLDPADGAFEGPADPIRFPSAVAALRGEAEAPAERDVGAPGPLLAGLPVLVVGAGRGGDCVPRSRNYGVFFDACSGPAVLVTLPEVGHLQFLDPSQELGSAICAAGRGVRNQDVARASGRLAGALARAVAARSMMSAGGQRGAFMGLDPAATAAREDAREGSGAGEAEVSVEAGQGAGSAGGGGAVGDGDARSPGSGGTMAGGSIQSETLRELCEGLLEGSGLRYAVRVVG